MNLQQGPTSSWQVVKLLLGAARKRSKARGRKQKQLMGHRRGRAVTVDWGVFGFLLAILISSVIQALFAFASVGVAELTQRLLYEERGVIVVENSSMRDLQEHWPSYSTSSDPQVRKDEKQRLDLILKDIAYSKYEDLGRAQRHQKVNELWSHLRAKGVDGFISQRAAEANLKEKRPPAVDWMIAFFILWWAVTLALQGEGMEMDVTRRRYPVWEWLACHPITSRAWFLAEMISPMAANPLFFSAPIYWGGLFWWFHGNFFIGAAAGVLVGLPFAIALSCVGKALETWCMLRLSVRSRGAALGIMSWIGYASFMLVMFFGIKVEHFESLFRPVVPWLHAPMPLIGWMFGLGMGSWMAGVLCCWLGICLIIVAAVMFTARATDKGLAGNEGGKVKPDMVLRKGGFSAHLKDPLYHKELLWLKRDRGALIQVFLIPLTMALAQSYNLRNVASLVGDSWTSWAGACVLIGTYFLYMLGPRSLVTEGTALWIPMTWPRSLEQLLLAKAKLWSAIASGIVYTGLGIAIYVFPASYWKIVLVGIGWHFFGSSFARRAVTLVRTPSSSGEPEPLSTGQRLAVLMGMTSFAVGVMSQNWSVAVIGIVYSWFVSAAIWQNFRERLPFLFDPWSEKLPQPPTLVHSMVAVCALMEMMAVVYALTHLAKLPKALESAICYGVSGTVVCAGTMIFLRRREVTLLQIWRWAREGLSFTWSSALKQYGLALLMGGGLGLIGCGYLWLIERIPWLHELAKQSVANDSFSGDKKFWLYLLSVGMAPIAEEYLFRGLFFRALDREWGGWRALAGGAVFFAIYHPVISWAPVALVGLANCWLYRKTGRLSCCVIVHMVYNAIVV